MNHMRYRTESICQQEAHTAAPPPGLQLEGLIFDTMLGQHPSSPAVRTCSTMSCQSACCGQRSSALPRRPPRTPAPTPSASSRRRSRRTRCVLHRFLWLTTHYSDCCLTCNCHLHARPFWWSAEGRASTARLTTVWSGLLTSSCCGCGRTPSHTLRRCRCVSKSKALCCMRNPCKPPLEQCLRDAAAAVLISGENKGRLCLMFTRVSNMHVLWAATAGGDRQGRRARAVRPRPEDEDPCKWHAGHAVHGEHTPAAAHEFLQSSSRPLWRSFLEHTLQSTAEFPVSAFACQK